MINYLITFDLFDRKAYRKLKAAINGLGPGRWVQRSVRVMSSPLDGDTIIGRLEEVTGGRADLLVVKTQSVHVRDRS